MRWWVLGWGVAGGLVASALTIWGEPDPHIPAWGFILGAFVGSAACGLFGLVVPMILSPEQTFFGEPVWSTWWEGFCFYW